MDSNHIVMPKEEVESFLDRLKYALEGKRRCLSIQKQRKCDENKDLKYTYLYTIHDLAPESDPYEYLKEQLKTLSIEEYMHTVYDTKYPNRKELFVFAKKYNDFVYIKLRVELMNTVDTNIFILSFHYSEYEITENCFPYKEGMI